MKSSILLLIALASPMVGAAQPPAPKARVFISPSGEPFHPTAAAPDPFETWFSRVDAAHDGRIGRDEFRADAVQYFKRLDVNGDGVIDGFEIAAYEKSVAPELAIDGQGFAADTSSKIGPVSLLSDPEPVSGADIRLDSRITMDEWRQAADRRFDLLDVKHQGFLSRDGLRALLPKSERVGKP